jgi:hypothetical protein
VTYDTDAVRQWSSATDGPVSWIFERALNGDDYPRERGIRSIRLIPDGNEIIVAPSDAQEVLVSFSPCITLPLDMLERLVEMADRAAGRSGSDRSTIEAVRREITGIRDQMDDAELVLVPRMKLGRQTE